MLLKESDLQVCSTFGLIHRWANTNDKYHLQDNRLSYNVTKLLHWRHNPLVSIHLKTKCCHQTLQPIENKDIIKQYNKGALVTNWFKQSITNSIIDVHSHEISTTSVKVDFYMKVSFRSP